MGFTHNPNMYKLRLEIKNIKQIYVIIYDFLAHPFLGAQNKPLTVMVLLSTQIIGQGFSWTEIYFRHFVQAASILFGHLENF